MHVGRWSDDGRASGCTGDAGHVVEAPRLRRRALRGVLPVLVIALCLASAATASAFTARGSVEQVDVTGLAPGAQMSLLRSNGETVSTQTAAALGALLFRKVTPGKHYTVRLGTAGEESAAITVHTQAAKPWDRSI